MVRRTSESRRAADSGRGAAPRPQTGAEHDRGEGESDGQLTEIRGMIEKPPPGSAPSNLMLPGRYILQPEVMRQLDLQETGAGGEIQLTDAMAALIGKQPFHAWTFEGERHDCGSAAGFVIANLALALQRDDVAPRVRDYLKGA